MVEGDHDFLEVARSIPFLRKYKHSFPTNEWQMQQYVLCPPLAGEYVVL